MMVELDDEFLDEIIRTALVRDYIFLTDKIKNPQGWHKDDIDSWHETVQGIELVSKWYFINFKEAVTKARKAMKKK